MNKYQLPRHITIACLSLFGILSSPLESKAEKTNPDFVPPDITLALPNAYSRNVTQPAINPGTGNMGGMQQNTPAGNNAALQALNSAGSMNVPGLGQVNPFALRPADRMRLPPGTNIPSRGSSPPPMQNFQQQYAQPPAGSSAFMQPGQAPPGAGTSLAQESRQLNEAALQSKIQGDPVMTIQTVKGPIVIRLFKEHAPITVAAIIEMVNSGFYNGLNFHRVEPGFVIQGGCPAGNGTGNYVPPGQSEPRFLPLEISQSARHNAPGVVAMARQPNNKNSSSCQFYITLAAKQQLDNQYTVVGGVIQGMEVVYRIARGDKIISITMNQ